MRILGAILAGGQSRRFGSDKAEALYKGRSLLDHVADALRPQADNLVVAGRNWPDIESVLDMPEAGLGPLGGLAGALHFGQQNGFDAVLSSGCDLLDIPLDLVSQLGAGPVIVDDQPLLAIWPVGVVTDLVAWLGTDNNRSVYRFADHVGVRRVTLSAPVRNANRPTDLG